MSNMSRRSVLMAGSSGLAAAGRLARPYIANAAGEDRRLLAQSGLHSSGRRGDEEGREDYMKASGNKLDYSIMPFMAHEPEDDIGADQRRCAGPGVHGRAAVDPAAECLGRQTGRRDRRRGCRTSRSSRRPRSCARPSTTRRRRSASYYLCPIKQGATPFHIWGDLVEKAGFKVSDDPEELGRVLELLQADAGAAARQGHAEGLRAWPADHHRRTERRQQPVRAFPDRQWRRGYRHAGRQAAHRRSEGARGGDQVGRVHDRPLQGRRGAAGGAELERRRRQQRLP